MVDYTTLTRPEFDAMVTGELTHYAVWLERALETAIIGAFIDDDRVIGDFQRLILRRDGLTFQDKIDVVRAMLRSPTISAAPEYLKRCISRLQEVEELKRFRNAMAHGLDASDSDDLELDVEYVSRTGREQRVTINPASHEKMLREVDDLLSFWRNFSEKAPMLYRASRKA